MPTLTANNSGSTNVATTTETVVCTAAPVNTPAGGRVVLNGNVQVVAGTAATQITVRIRRGVDVTGVQVGNAVADTAVAGQQYNLDAQEVDTPPEEAGASYVLTVQQTAATGAGTVTQATLRADF